MPALHLIVSLSFWSAAALHLTHSSEVLEPDDTFFKDVPPSWGRPVFYSIVMGNLTRRHQINTVVGSLRQVGGWMGPIVIVTDNAICIADTLTRAGLIRPRLSDVDVDSYDSLQHPGTVHIVKAARTNKQILMKRQKVLAWENVARTKIPKVSHIVYMDEDIVIGNRLDVFMRYLLSTYKRETTLALFPDLGFTYGEFHTGVLVMYHTVANKACLKSWGEALSQAEDAIAVRFVQLEGPDQQILARVDQCTAGLQILYPKFLLLPTKGILREGKTSTFVHFTNTGRWWLVPKEDGRRWMYDVLGLSPDLDVYGKSLCAKV